MLVFFFSGPLLSCKCALVTWVCVCVCAYPTTNGGGIQNGSSVGTHTHCMHVFLSRLAAIWMLSRCLLTKSLHRSSVGSSLRVRCWLGRYVYEGRGAWLSWKFAKERERVKKKSLERARAGEEGREGEEQAPEGCEKRQRPFRTARTCLLH